MKPPKQPLVGIIMGSDSDLPIMRDAAKIFDEFKMPYEITVVSAHRTPERAHDYAKTAVDRGLKVIIAAAGGAAHLAGVTAAMTPLPVIGVPIKTDALNGVDALYSTVQMPPGVPVATVAINGAKNAAILAIEMLGIADESMRQKIADYKKRLSDAVLEKAANLGKE